MPLICIVRRYGQVRACQGVGIRSRSGKYAGTPSRGYPARKPDPISMLNTLRAILTVFCIPTIVAGCASLPPLDDASLAELELASADDISRHDEAQKQYYRDLFEGTTVTDGKGNVVASFSPDQYDDYLAHLGRKDELTLLDRLPGHSPILRMSFESPRVLSNPEISLTMVELYVCDENERESYVSSFRRIMWQGRVVTAQTREEIETAIDAGQTPQRYEIFFGYGYRATGPDQDRSGPLAALPGDVCMAYVSYSMIRPPLRGKPMRIGRDAVNKLIGPVLASETR